MSFSTKLPVNFILLKYFMKRSLKIFYICVGVGKKCMTFKLSNACWQTFVESGRSVSTFTDVNLLVYQKLLTEKGYLTFSSKIYKERNVLQKITDKSVKWNRNTVFESFLISENQLLVRW